MYTFFTSTLPSTRDSVQVFNELNELRQQLNQLNEEKAAANYELPLEAIREALDYVEANKELLETEAEIERLMLKRGGVALGPQTVSG